MKQIRTLIATALFVLLISAQANAADTIRNNNSLPVELKYAGTIKDQPLLLLNFSGSKEDNEFSISVTDEAGIVLYTANVKGEKFSKQFLLNTDDLGDAILRFEITGKKSGKKTAYQVSMRRKITEQMDLVKL